MFVCLFSYQTVFYKNCMSLLKAIKEARTYGRPQDFPVAHMPVAKCTGFDKVVDRSCIEGATSTPRSFSFC